MRPCRVIFSVAVASVLIAFGSAWSDAHAQAWVADKGALDLSLDYNFATSDKVVGDGSIVFPNAGTMTHQVTLGGEYVPVDRLALNIALPFVLLTYTGDKTLYPHPGGGSYDDGSAHAALTDLRIGARYQVLDEPFALTPHLAVSIPVTDYETVGNTVAGRHLKALHAGVGLGRVIGEAAYVHLLYEFSLVEKYDRTPDTQKVGQNRSDFGLTIGYKLLDQKLDIHLDANGRLTHDGVNFSQFGMLATTAPDQVQFHDPLLEEDILLVGGGVGYQMSNALAATLSARLFVAGKNTQNASVIALGVTWSPL
jgi:hypothetical protein